jgi:hypothetical protein
MRLALLVILAVGLVGVELELLLLGHTEDPWQWTPIILIGISLAVIAWHAIERGAASVRALQIVMGLFVVAGLLGLFLHFRGNIVFEQEMTPDAPLWPLLWAALRGATPTLAPGTMVQLGLIGLLYAYRHPARHPGTAE